MSDSGNHEPAVADDRHTEPVEVLRDLIRFDTTNPPGDERACIEWICDLLEAYGVGYETYAADPERPSVVARLEGGEAEPLMLYGHVDVVAAEGDWTHPPFEAVIDDGFIWGRGALDMKAGIAMFLSAFLQIASESSPPPGDLVLCIVPDEEAGGDEGLSFLVDEHPDIFTDIDYALGEFGGFPMTIAGQRFYPIQVNEKQICWLKATFEGDGGHGSLPREDDATARMARFIDQLDGARLPVHITPTLDMMVERMGRELPTTKRLILGLLGRPALTDRILNRLGDDGEMFDALTHNVANETIVRGGNKENVVPEEVTVTLDCRLLPGQSPDDVIRELRSLVGTVSEHVEFEVQRYDPGPPEPDMGLFDHLGGVLEAADEESAAIPLLMPATTDGRHLSRVDVQSYGFTPMNLPDDFAFLDVVHAPDERIPPECVGWGTQRVYDAVQHR